jgi:hypothetical protein
MSLVGDFLRKFLVLFVDDTRDPRTVVRINGDGLFDRFCSFNLRTRAGKTFRKRDDPSIDSPPNSLDLSRDWDFEAREALVGRGRRRQAGRISFGFDTDV